MTRPRICAWALIVVPLIFTGHGPGLANDGKWTFFVLGDTRGPKHSTTGISDDLALIAQEVATVKPDFVLHTGDLTSGYYLNANIPIVSRAPLKID